MMLPTRSSPGTVCLGVVAPHGNEAIAEACDEATRTLAVRTQRALDAVGRRVAAASPDALVVTTPHNVHVAGHMAVVTSSRVSGQLEETANPVSFACAVDRQLALAIREAMNAAGVPTVGVSFGGNVASESVAPLDWGAIVPLWHVARHAPDLPAVVIAPAREMDAESHVRAGAAVVRASRAEGRRIVFVASADQGHGHRDDGPYGFHQESAPFDARITDIVERNALQELVGIPVAEVGAAVADSWWQMLMLHGALQEDGGEFRSEILAYEAPTYFGMLTAVFEPT